MVQFVEGKVRLDEHICDIVIVIEGCKVENVVAFVICAEDVGSTLGEDFHNLAVTEFAGNPKTIHTKVIPLINV